MVYFPSRDLAGPDSRLISVAQTHAGDAAAIATGTSGLALMERAGAAVADAAADPLARGGSVRILCGPGNNGGDGFVVARLLKQRGVTVSLALLGDPARLSGDAAVNHGRWDGVTEPLDGHEPVEAHALVVDALFGAGLSRPVAGAAAKALEAWDASGKPVLAVDIPSGVHGDTGQVCGTAIAAHRTVTFCRAKPGHLLMPGRDLAGDLVVADIGIPSAALPTTDIVRQNAPVDWETAFPWRQPWDHKFSAGHLLVIGGPMTGAGRLAVRGARRIGCGLVSVAAAPADALLFAADAPGTIVRPVDTASNLAGLTADPRLTACVIGPGLGTNRTEADLVAAVLKARRATVLDADALTVLAADRAGVRGLAVLPSAVLTPHLGEFQRLAPDLDAQADRVTAARTLAGRTSAVIVLKGADTVIAAPDGRCAINASAPPELATAGSGDVLAGMVGGLLAQGMPAYRAACAAVWLHGAVALGCGHGLIAEDLPDRLPTVLAGLRVRREPTR